MSHDPSSVSLADAELVYSSEPLRISRRARFIFYLMIFLGVGSFLMGLAFGDSRQAWMALLVNFVFWFGVAAASAGFSAVFQICNAQWARPVRRVFESSTPFLLYSPLVLLVFYFGHGELFIWAHHDIPGKGIWLTSNFVFARALMASFFLAWLISRNVFHSKNIDELALAGGLLEVSEDTKTKRKVKSISKEDASRGLALSRLRMIRLSPAIVIVYAFLMSLIAFDLIMSIDTHWYSTMFGTFYFMSAVYVAVAFACIGTTLLRLVHPLFREKVERRTLHDLGKLLFGFGIFWAYLFWSHYLPIWYGNLPEETGYIIIRLREEPWHSFAWLIFGLCFIIPFFLGLSRDVKQVPILLFATSVLAAVGVFLQQYLLIAPTLTPDRIPLNLVDLGVALGFLAAYLLSSISFLANAPLMPLGDLCEQYNSHRT